MDHREWEDEGVVIIFELPAVTKRIIMLPLSGKV